MTEIRYQAVGLETELDLPAKVLGSVLTLTDYPVRIQATIRIHPAGLPERLPEWCECILESLHLGQGGMGERGWDARHAYVPVDLDLLDVDVIQYLQEIVLDRTEPRR